MPEQNTALVKKDASPLGVLRIEVEKMRGELEKALPKHIPADKMIRVAMTAIQKTPKLLQCDKLTVLKAVMEAAQLGLVTDGVLGHAYMVPYGTQCQLIVGFRGLIDLAMRSGKVSSIYADVIHENDSYRYQKGDDPRLEHAPTIGGDRGAMIAAYAVARIISDPNHPRIELMSKDEIDGIRKRSRASDNGPWVSDYEEMAKKTVLRRLCKTLSLSPELTEAAVRGEYHEVQVLDQQDRSITTPGRHKFGFGGRQAAPELAGVASPEVGEAPPADSSQPEEIPPPAPQPHKQAKAAALKPAPKPAPRAQSEEQESVQQTDESRPMDDREMAFAELADVMMAGDIPLADRDSVIKRLFPGRRLDSLTAEEIDQVTATILHK